MLMGKMNLLVSFSLNWFSGLLMKQAVCSIIHNLLLGLAFRACTYIAQLISTDTTNLSVKGKFWIVQL